MNIGSTTTAVSLPSTTTTSSVEETNKRKYPSEISESIDRNVRPAIDLPSNTLTPAPLKPWVQAINEVEEPLQELVSYGIIDSNERKNYLLDLIPSSPDQINLDQWTRKVFQTMKFYAYSNDIFKQRVSSFNFSDFSPAVKSLIRSHIQRIKMTFSEPFKIDPITKTITWPHFIKFLTGKRGNVLSNLSERISFPVLLKNPELEKPLKDFIRNYREYLMQQTIIGPSEAIQIEKADDLLQQTDPVMVLEFENGKTIILNQARVDVIKKLSEALGKHFNNNMQEGIAKKVLLKGVSWEDFKTFINYLFHGNNLPLESIGSLIQFANMYFIETLFQKCLNVLIGVDFFVKENNILFNKNIATLKNILIESKWEKVKSDLCSHLLTKFFDGELKTLPYDCPLLKPTSLTLTAANFNKTDATLQFFLALTSIELDIIKECRSGRIKILKQVRKFPHLSTLKILKIISFKEVVGTGFLPSLRHLKIDSIVETPQEVQIQAVFSKCPLLEKVEVKVWDNVTGATTSLSFDRKSKQ